MAGVEIFSFFDTVFRVRCSKTNSISTTDRAPPNSRSRSPSLIPGWLPHTALSLEDAEPLLYRDSSAQVIFRGQCFNWHFSVKSANRFKTRYTQAAVYIGKQGNSMMAGVSFPEGTKPQNIAAAIK